MESFIVLMKDGTRIECPIILKMPKIRERNMSSTMEHLQIKNSNISVQGLNVDIVPTKLSLICYNWPIENTKNFR